MQKYIYTSEQYTHMCDLAQAAIDISPECSAFGHHDMLQDIRLLLSGLKLHTVPGKNIQRYEMGVLQYNLMIKYISWARFRAAPELLGKLNVLLRTLKSGRMESVTSVIAVGKNAHTR